MTFVAQVEYTDREDPEEIRGYQEAQFRMAGVVRFIWDDEFLTIPLHRIKSIAETTLEEGGK